MRHRNIKLADGSQEDYIDNLVKDAMAMYERILNVPLLAQIIVEPEKRDGQNSLCNNSGKLVVLALTIAGQEERKRVMDSLEDYHINHKYMSSDLSNFQGHNSHVGSIHLC